MDSSKQTDSVIPAQKKEPPNCSLKNITYFNPNVKIGEGKFGPIELIIYNNEIWALKRIPKSTIDKIKRLEHLKNEK